MPLKDLKLTFHSDGPPRGNLSKVTLYGISIVMCYVAGEAIIAPCVSSFYFIRSVNAASWVPRLTSSKYGGSCGSRRGTRGGGGVRARGARKNARGLRARLQDRKMSPCASAGKDSSRAGGDSPATPSSNNAACAAS